MKTNKRKITETVKSQQALNVTSEIFYTPRTFGALHEQLEFDFGPEFTEVDSETIVETNSKGVKHGGRNYNAVSKKAEGDN